MAKVTSKLQLTVPKAVADQYGIRPGDELDWVPAGESIRVIPVRNKKKSQSELSVKQRLELFDRATERQKNRQYLHKCGHSSATQRGWKREDLYTRGLTH